MNGPRHVSWVVARVLAVAVVTAGLGAGCDGGADAPATGEPDARLRTHEVLPSTPTPEGLAFIEAVAAVHRTADELQGPAQAEALRQGLTVPVPKGLPEAELLRLQLVTRLAQLELSKPGGEVIARDLLAPMLKPSRSLPLDRSTAEALVVLGDAATKTGDDALAAGTYARAIRMMRILQQELQP